MTASDRTDLLAHLLVVGASFAGVACAIEAARAGLQVILLERKTALGEKLHDVRLGTLFTAAPYYFYYLTVSKGRETERYNSFSRADIAALEVGSITVTAGIERSHVNCLLANCRVAAIPAARNSSNAH